MTFFDRLSDLFGKTIFHPQYFAKRGEYDCIRTIVESGKGGTFLDIGCGRQAYRPILEPLFSTYYALDHPTIKDKYQTPYPIELISDATKIPLADRSVDVAQMILVIEHLEDPGRAIAEVRRVIKPKGQFLLFAVENYPHHDKPQSFQHFTKAGLEQLVKNAGLTMTSHISYGNFWEVLVTFQNIYLMQRVKQTFNLPLGRLWGILLLALCAPIMILGNCLAWLLGPNQATKEFAIGHLIIAQPLPIGRLKNR